MCDAFNHAGADDEDERVPGAYGEGADLNRAHAPILSSRGGRTVSDPPGVLATRLAWRATRITDVRLLAAPALRPPRSCAGVPPPRSSQTADGAAAASTGIPGGTAPPRTRDATAVP